MRFFFFSSSYLCTLVKACKVTANGNDKVGRFYRAMHYTAKCGLAIASRPSVCLSVTLVDLDHRLEILETNCTDN